MVNEAIPDAGAGAVRENVAVAAVYMVAASAFFTTLAALVKLASDEATPLQAMLYRSVFSALPMLVIMKRRHIPLSSRRRGLLTIRGVVGGSALFCYLYAVAHIRLADLSALQQLAPIFVAFLSVVLLHERPRPLHYALAALCLLGALVVLQPTRGLASLGAGVALLSAVLSAGAYVSVRTLTRTEPTPRIVLWFSGVAGLMALPLVLLNWQPLSLRAHLLLVGAGVMAAGAQSLMTASYRRAPAHIAASFSYASVPLGYLAGLVFWNERPDRLANVGIFIILVAGVAIVYSVRPRRAPPA
ncbi:MAG: DMT family transporter [Deltaproteobacteria bacterium]|nr:DMT family transporter [Deltaproteobacteria bacterium]